MLARTINRFTTKIILLTGTSLALAAGGVVTYVAKSATMSAPPAPAHIQLRTNRSTIRLSDAISLAQSTSEQSNARPLTLATADFDEDGTPDLLSGAVNAGVGFLSFYRGNVEAVYATKRRTEPTMPFFPASRFVNLPTTPDFLVTGDFNADGHSDAVMAARNGTALYLLAGDGQGGFAEAVPMALSSEVTALAAGEINRVDGLPDLAVGLNSNERASVLLLTAQEGAWAATPQSFTLAHSATSVEFAHLTRDGLSDLAIAAGNELVVLEGGQHTPRVTRTPLSFAADSLAVGRFTKDQEQLAVQSRDGAVSVASYERTTEQRGRQSNRTRANNGWQVSPYFSDASARLENSASRQLLRAHISASKHDDLLTLQGSQLQFVTNNDAPQSAAATLDGNADLIAALPLRTNASALQGLVLLSRNQPAPLLVQPMPEATFAVNSILDAPDQTPGDGVCSASAGAPICTLRAAIQEANATTGADTITFNIGAGPQLISPATSLPTITNPIVLDAVTGAPATQVVSIREPGQFTSSNVLELTSSGNTIRGLTFVVRNSSFTSIFLNSSNDNFIEGNTMSGGGGGIVLSSSSRNTIGGTAAAARNVIGGNSSVGVLIAGATSTTNRILGNFIGTDATGTTANANGVGVSIDRAVNNTIGGTTATARNVISGNFSDGIDVDGTPPVSLLTEAADGNLIQGNYIGVDAAGVSALGNGVLSEGTAAGISIDGASNTTLGGTAANAGNVIANNSGAGVRIFPRSTIPGAEIPVNNAIQGNSIYSNGELGIDLDAAGISANDTGDGDTGANNLQNYPILTAALTRTTGTTVTGTLNSTANSTFSIELFNNPICDASGNGEGQTFVTRATVATNAAGLASFSIATSTPILAGRFITATATDANGNTSEFSACRAVQNATVDLNVAQTVSPNPVLVGNNLIYNVTVTNSGPDDATGVVLTNTLTIPNGQFTLVSTTPSQGTCTGAGPINCSLGTIAATANATVRIVITPAIPTTGTPPNSVTATNTATASSNELDSLPPNNTNATGAVVNAAADLAIAQTVNIVGSPNLTVVTYTITITNNGPSTANSVSARFDPPPVLRNVTCTAPAGWSCNRDGNPFFAFAASQMPGSAVFTVSGSVGCLPTPEPITSTVTVSSSTTDVNTTNNTATLNNALQPGFPTGAIAYDVANTTALQFGPVVAGSTGAQPSGTFTVNNLGCVPISLGSAQFVRAGNPALLSGVDDSRNFSLRLVPASGAEILLNPTPNPNRNAAQPIPVLLTVGAGQSLRFRVTFNPPLPFFAGTFALRDQGVFANQVLPDSFASSLVINSNAGNLTANLAARVAPAIQIIPRDGNLIGNPATTPLVIMENLRGDFRVRVSMYDANKNATRITYQFFDTFLQPASSPIAVDLTSLISASPLLAGQAFTLQQDFSGAAARPDIVYVRVTVNDGDATTVSASSNPLLPALAGPTALFSLESRGHSDVLQLPGLRLDGSAATPIRQTDSRRSSTNGQ